VNLDKTLIILLILALIAAPTIFQVWFSSVALGRLGLNRWLSLLAVFSWVGVATVLAILAFADVPALRDRVGLTSAST